LPARHCHPARPRVTAPISHLNPTAIGDGDEAAAAEQEREGPPRSRRRRAAGRNGSSGCGVGILPRELTHLRLLGDRLGQVRAVGGGEGIASSASDLMAAELPSVAAAANSHIDSDFLAQRYLYRSPLAPMD
jgi:hypothetical protein